MLDTIMFGNSIYVLRGHKIIVFLLVEDAFVSDKECRLCDDEILHTAAFVRHISS